LVWVRTLKVVLCYLIYVAGLPKFVRETLLQKEDCIGTLRIDGVLIFNYKLFPCEFAYYLTIHINRGNDYKS